MVRPGVQKPHCSAPSAAMQRAKAAASSATPSMVVISRPPTRAVRVQQESTGRPSSQTVHSPHDPVSQPCLTLK